MRLPPNPAICSFCSTLFRPVPIRPGLDRRGSLEIYIFGSVHAMYMKITLFDSVGNFLSIELVKCQYFSDLRPLEVKISFSFLSCSIRNQKHYLECYFQAYIIFTDLHPLFRNIQIFT
jgi:hypothetical protein